jgi:AraC-like DNA-binding protein
MRKLDDLFISHDAIGILQGYISREGLKLPEFQHKLGLLAKRHAISFSIWWQLLDELIALVNRPALGSIIGLSAQPKQTGIMGYLTQTSANLLDALRCFERFQPLVYAGNRAHIRLKGTRCIITWDNDHGYSTQASDEVITASLLSIMRHCLQDDQLGLESLSFTNQPNAPVQLYKALYGCDALFGQSHLSLSFDSRFLVHPISSQDSGLHNILIEQAQNKLPEVESLPDNKPLLNNEAALNNQTNLKIEVPFELRLQQAITRALHEGKPSAAHIAGKLHISSRTLHRRLAGQGLIFRNFLRKVRKELAAQYLLENHLTLTEIALLLGYSEQSAFSRAFMIWYHVTPSEFKVSRFQ